MLLVKTIIKLSDINGIGLFADEFIKKGTIIWKFEPTIDILLSKDEFLRLPEFNQQQLRKYVFFDNTYNKYMLCGDHARFLNHCDNPNCDDSLPNMTIALRDIPKGEELTVDYKTFYGDIDDHPEIF